MVNDIVYQRWKPKSRDKLDIAIIVSKQIEEEQAASNTTNNCNTKSCFEYVCVCVSGVRKRKFKNLDA